MLKTKTETVSVERTTATCEVCGWIAVVVEKTHETDRSKRYLEAARDPLCPDNEPSRSRYSSHLCFSIESDVFVEIEPGIYQKEERLVCNMCTSERTLIIPLKTQEVVE